MKESFDNCSNVGKLVEKIQVADLSPFVMGCGILVVEKVRCVLMGEMKEETRCGKKIE
jgi:hypothetical protein